MKGTYDRWTHWWFGPVDARLLAALRIAVAAVALTVHASWWWELDILLDANGLAPLRVELWRGRGWTVFALPWARDHAALVHGLTVLPLVGLLLGWRSRSMAVLSWMVVLGWYQRVPGASSGGDRLLRYALLFLATGPCGAAWSLDARKWPASTVPMLPLRLVQLQWCVMYLSTGLDKLQGAPWVDGTALHWSLSSRTFARFPDADLHTIGENTFGQAVLAVSTWLVLGWELVFAGAVWTRRGRGIVLLVGLLVHSGIGLLMSVGPFTLVAMVGYLAFLDRWVRRSGGAVQSSGAPREPRAAPP